MADSHNYEDDALLDAEPDYPTRSRSEWQQSNKKVGELYNRIRWDEWWDEFLTAVDDKFKPKYRNALMFAKAKGENQWEQEMIFKMIGPKPQTKPIQHPWLGDWTRIRNAKFWAPMDAKKLEGIKRAYQERVESIEAARELAPIVARQLARLERVKELIDEAYGNQVFVPGETADSDTQQRRFNAYMQMQGTVHKREVEACNLWLMIHGLNPNQPQLWLNMATSPAVMKALEENTEDGRLPQLSADSKNPQSFVLPPGVTLDDLLMAKHTRAMAETYKLNDVPTLEANTKEDKKVH